MDLTEIKTEVESPIGDSVSSFPLGSIKQENSEEIIIKNEIVEFPEVPKPCGKSVAENRVIKRMRPARKNKKADNVPEVFDNFVDASAVDPDDIWSIPNFETVLARASKIPILPLPEDVEVTVSQIQNTTPVQRYLLSKYVENEYQFCLQCLQRSKPEFTMMHNGYQQFFCDDICLNAFKLNNSTSAFVTECASTFPEVVQLQSNYLRCCAACSSNIADPEVNLSWEAMDFCNQYCLSRYLKQVGSVCCQCFATVSFGSLGKFSVRFGDQIKQFCSSKCLNLEKEKFKMCSYCHQDMLYKKYGFLAPVGEKEEFREFCSQECIEKFEVIKNKGVPHVEPGTQCFYCKTYGISIEFRSSDVKYFCGEECFLKFVTIYNVNWGRCSTCNRCFPEGVLEENAMFFDNERYGFCSSACKNIYLTMHRKIIACFWCKVKKYNFDLIRRFSKKSPWLTVCNLTCLNLLQTNWNILNAKKIACTTCRKITAPMFHITMTDSTVRSFCTYSCVTRFQNQFKANSPSYSKDLTLPRPVGEPKRNSNVNVEDIQTTSNSPSKLVISQVRSLANSKIGDKLKVKKYFIIKPPPLPDQRNVGTMCKVRQNDKGISVKLAMVDKQSQTEKIELNRILLPVPVPIYVPTPLPSYSVPTPYPIPIPTPIPIPIFIATTRNSIKGIMQELKKIQTRTPSNPYEADLLAMADMVASDTKNEQTDSDSDIEDGFKSNLECNVMLGNSFEDVDCMLDLAYKMATEIGCGSGEVQNKEESQKRNAIEEEEPNSKRVKTDESPEALLKYSYGVSAWNQWATTKMVKSNILHMTVDELNCALMQFLKDLRKPSGTEYAPDTIFYLCLGIQQYLNENHRSDNIFHDPFYQKFIEAFDEVAKKFSKIFDDSHYVVTRVEEEHLWEAKQLGISSPNVLLTTLVFFSMKYFDLQTIQEHSVLAFTQIVKQLKKKPGESKSSRKQLLRFYPPPAIMQMSGNRKKMYELIENFDSPDRCPVKMFEYYLSKCPESVKGRNDMFYLEPERSCVADSPLWFSANVLAEDVLSKIINRLSMVKEINLGRC